MFNFLAKILYVAALISIPLSIMVYNNNPQAGIFIGLWVPTLLLLGPSCPWKKD
jgi:hypothetical protein